MDQETIGYIGGIGTMAQFAKDVEVATSIVDRLEAKKSKLSAELADTNAALKALNENPKIAEVLTLIGRAISRY